MQRRDFLKVLAGAAVSTQLTSCAWGNQVRFISAHNDPKGRHYIAGIDAQGKRQFSLPIALRGHGMTVNPVYPHKAVFVSRRPGAILQHVNLVSGEIIANVSSSTERHFVGHGCFSKDGNYMFTPENDFAKGRGCITIRDADTLKVLDEMPSYGVGPHEVRFLSDGKTLVVANGGILTHPKTPRKKLNIPTMRPSLAYVDITSGKLLSDYRLPDHQQSIRHIDISENDVVAMAIQYEGDIDKLVPLVATHQGEDAVQVMEGYSWEQLKQYTGSVTFAGNGSIFAVSSPRGHRLTLWDANSKQFIREFPMRDVCGIAWDAVYSRFVVTTGIGYVYQVGVPDFSINVLRHDVAIKWDNHLVAV